MWVEKNVCLAHSDFSNMDWEIDQKYTHTQTHTQRHIQGLDEWAYSRAWNCFLIDSEMVL